MAQIGKSGCTEDFSGDAATCPWCKPLWTWTNANHSSLYRCSVSLSASSPAGLMLHNIGATCFLVYPFIFPHRSDNISFIPCCPPAPPLPTTWDCATDTVKRQPWITSSRYVPTSSKQLWKWLWACINLPISYRHGWLVDTCSQQPACLDRLMLC